MQQPLTPFQQALVEVELAQKKAEELRQLEFDSVIAEMKEKIALYGITAKDLGFVEPAEKPPRPMVEQRKDQRSIVRPKYRSAAGEEWSGRGKAPSWVTKHIMAGGKIEDFLISKNNAGDKNE